MFDIFIEKIETIIVLVGVYIKFVKEESNRSIEIKIGLKSENKYRILRIRRYTILS